MNSIAQLTALLLSLQALLGQLQAAQKPAPSAIIATSTVQITMAKDTPKSTKTGMEALREQALQRKCPVKAEDGLAKLGRNYSEFELVILNRNCK